jgi:hypothetical protein
MNNLKLNIELTKENLEDLIIYIYEISKRNNPIEANRTIRDITHQIIYINTGFYSVNLLKSILDEIRIKKDEKIIKFIIE